MIIMKFILNLKYIEYLGNGVWDQMPLKIIIKPSKLECWCLIEKNIWKVYLISIFRLNTFFD